MALRCGSLSGSLISRTSSSLFRSQPRSLSRPLRSPPSLLASRLQSRRFVTRSFGELGCSQSLLPLCSVVAATRLTPHLSVAVRGCCELSHGTFCRTCQDR